MLSSPPAGLPQGAVVLHLAGMTRGAGEDLRQNSAIVPGLLESCRRIGARRLLFVSTAAVYAPGPLAMAEDLPVMPASAYGRSKADAEALVRAQTDVPVTVLRLGNVAGADALLGPRPAGGQIVLDPVPQVPGGPTRSWIGARTLARLLAALCLRQLPPVLNIAQSPPLAMADLLEAAGLDWCFGPFNREVVPVATLDVSRLQSICPLPAAAPVQLAAEAAWARGVLG